MRLTVIGSGTVAPSADRAGPSYWIETGGLRLLLECGPGMLHGAARLGIPWGTATHVMISHFHPDHWGELPSYLFALRWGMEPPRTDPLTLLAPVGVGARLTLVAGAYGERISHPDFPLDIVELSPGQHRALGHGVALETCKTAHTEESLAYAVRAGDVRLVYTGDTGPSDELAAFAAGCDLLVAECSLPDERAVDLHLTPTQAGVLARAADARRLVLTHFYPVFGGTDPARVAAAEYGGDVVAARDGDAFTVGPT